MLGDWVSAFVGWEREEKKSSRVERAEKTILFMQTQAEKTGRMSSHEADENQSL